MTEHTKLPWRVDPISLWIVSDNVPKGPMHVADVRGWGYLTGKGHGALALTDDEAIAIQAANAALIIQAVNSYPEMREALEWYANVGNYHPSTGAPMTPYVDGKPDPTKPLRDFGALARKALATDREVKE